MKKKIFKNLLIGGFTFFNKGSDMAGNNRASVFGGKFLKII